MSMFHEVAIQVRPTTFATFVQEVAAENLLSRKFWDLLASFDSETSLKSLNESKSEAGATVTLVSRRCREIVVMDTSEIVTLWKV